MLRSMPTSTAIQLAAFLDETNRPDHIWKAEELTAVFRHQLGAPVEFDLAARGSADARRIIQLTTASKLLIRSFEDLLKHEHPPLDLLIMTKDFAKASSVSKNPTLPKDIARVLYLAAIAAALVRCQRRISGLSDPELAHGLNWARQQVWVEGWLRDLLGLAIQSVVKVRKVAR